VIQVTKLKVNDRSTAYLTITLYDKDDLPANPTSATYSIKDADGQIVNNRQDVPLSFVLGVVEITLTKEDNIMGSPALKSDELRRVEVDAIYGAGDELHDVFEYYIGSLENF
jgi:hypothetical protein